jgi:hypothetical protein
MKILKTYFLYYPIFWAGYQLFKITRKTNWYPYVAFRRLFVLTKGASNDRLSEKLSKTEPPYPIDQVSGVLGSLGKQAVNQIAESIRENGFHVFDIKLSSDMIEQMTEFAKTTEATLIPPSPEGVKRMVYDKTRSLSPRYEFDEIALMSFPLIQKLSIDPTLFAVAQSYLEAKPIQDLTAMWWSTAFSKKASSEAAQLFHFDMDRIKFLKFFFYLTDVDTHTGPHCYIRGSHKNLPSELWKDGRIQDEEISKSIPQKDILEIAGSKGTIIAVDTRGLHKGKVLEWGERLILQFEFTNSLFGTTYNTINLQQQILPEVREVFNKFKHSYQRFNY